MTANFIAAQRSIVAFAGALLFTALLVASSAPTVVIA